MKTEFTCQVHSHAGEILTSQKLRVNKNIVVDALICTICLAFSVDGGTTFYASTAAFLADRRRGVTDCHVLQYPDRIHGF